MEQVGEGVKFERIRRITGYLVGSTDKFNDAKRAEESDRVKHDLKKQYRIKVWETEDDRKLGKSFEYNQHFENLDEAKLMADKLQDDNNYALVEVSDLQNNFYYSVEPVNENDKEMEM